MAWRKCGREGQEECRVGIQVLHSEGHVAHLLSSLPLENKSRQPKAVQRGEGRHIIRHLDRTGKSAMSLASGSTEDSHH